MKIKTQMFFENKTRLDTIVSLSGEVKFIFLNKYIYNEMTEKNLEIVNQDTFKSILNAKILPKYLTDINLKFLDFCNKDYIE
jgi:hypothetical protein